LIKRWSEKTLKQLQKQPPHLLVSVRNVAEAQSALAGGCDVLDLKEPGRGSLGMCDVPTIAAVVAFVRNSGSDVPISMALGEAMDWDGARSIPSLATRAAYLKLGTAGLGNEAGWRACFEKIRRRFEAAECQATDGRGDTASDRRAPMTKWIAVAYADCEEAKGPAPEQVIEMANECGFTGVLVDTHSKARGGLFDWMSVERLASLAILARTRRLVLALAGKLQVGDIPRLLAIGPQIVGIRSAACQAGVRTGDIKAAAVHAFRQALQDANQVVAADPGTTRRPDQDQECLRSTG
jgi:uncharacterized protein (UPF0264 family)